VLLLLLLLLLRRVRVRLCVQVGYPGFAIFTPGPLEELKVKEIKNGRLAMLAFIGFTMGAQVRG